MKSEIEQNCVVVNGSKVADFVPLPTSSYLKLYVYYVIHGRCNATLSKYANLSLQLKQLSSFLIPEDLLQAHHFSKCHVGCFDLL